jgi:hypothetical protein
LERPLLKNKSIPKILEYQAMAMLSDEAIKFLSIKAINLFGKMKMASMKIWMD